MEISFIQEEVLITSQTCRCCLSFSSEEPMDNLFECLYDNIGLHELLAIIAPVSISPDDGLTKSICENCKTRVIDAYCFRQSCIVSERSLRSSNVLKTEMNENYEALDLTLDSDENEIQDLDMDTEVLFSCDFCQLSFENSSEQAAHMDNCHQLANEISLESDAILVCVICGNICDSQEILEAHLKTHETAVEGETSDIYFVSEAEDENDVIVDPRDSRKNECYICGKLFPSPSKLRRHMSVHKDLVPPSALPQPQNKSYHHECEVCGKLLATPWKLKRHLRVHNKSKIYNGINQHRPYSCSLCDLKFWDNIKLERHQIVHSEVMEQSRIQHPDGHLFTCVVCLEKIPDFDDCIEHMKDHRLEIDDNSEVACKLCTKVYPKLANLIRHSRGHPENATHQCIYCRRRMGIGDEFIDHMLRHEGFKPFTCEVPSCGKGFIKPSDLRKHMASHDSNPRTFPCTQCSKTFADPEYLKRHLMRHNGVKQHACSLCPSQFVLKSDLNSHMTTHSGEKPFICDICPARFLKAHLLKSHQKTHTGEKNFACDFCDMRFMTSSHLRRHKRIHTSEKPYGCSHCGKRYSQSNDLMKHLKIHLGPNVYKCDIPDCQEAFAKFSELKSHKIHHYTFNFLSEN